jgi:two-component system osmolarity sensor histidine kinase EnvZ
MSPAPAASPKNNTQASPKLNLFWRTFILLVVLMGGGTLAWFQTYRILELGPQNRAIASQVAELLRVNAALLDHLSREDEQKVFTALEESKHVRFQTALPSDVLLPFKPQDALGIALSAAIQPTFDQPIVLAESVNGSAGIWVRVHVQNRDIWLTLNDLRHEGPSDETWLFWIGIAGVFSLAGAAAIAQLLNRPLTQIVYATGRVQDGNFHDAFLDENVLIHEVSLVNQRFNEMTAQLAKMDADRALMLAGISHDLRTPLARIRLELEMSVSDPVALDSIAQDIEQLDHIIDKFLDYARPMTKPLAPVAVIPVVEQACQTFADHPHLSITLDASLDADALDIENGAAAPQQATGWWQRQRKRGLERPCLYANASTMQASVVPLIRAGVIARPLVRLWSAHYAGQHICSASSCGAVSIAMDDGRCLYRISQKVSSEREGYPHGTAASPRTRCISVLQLWL